MSRRALFAPDYVPNLPRHGNPGLAPIDMSAVVNHTFNREIRAKHVECVSSYGDDSCKQYMHPLNDLLKTDYQFGNSRQHCDLTLVFKSVSTGRCILRAEEKAFIDSIIGDKVLIAFQSAHSQMALQPLDLEGVRREYGFLQAISLQTDPVTKEIHLFKANEKEIVKLCAEMIRIV